MTVIAILEREHRLFESLASRLRPSPELTEREARAQITEALFVLMPALGRHDELEDVVFDRPEAGWPKGAAQVHQLTEAQHASLSALRSEIGEVLAGEKQASFARLKDLAHLLCEKLRWHLQTEEMLLWPLYAPDQGRSVDGSIELQAGRNLRALEAAVERLELEARRRVRAGLAS